MPTKAHTHTTKGGQSSKKEAARSTTFLLHKTEHKDVPIDRVEFSPLNYRKYFSEAALQEFADELKHHGIISPLTLRPIATNRYELVVGERRLRAAKLAGLLTIPACVVNFTDEQVIEIQLSENLQRENPHPMDEAKGIGQMQQHGKTIDEIAVRLGRSKQFVYGRLKLLSLTDSFQEMLYAGSITLQDALQIATVSSASQAEFFNDRCSDWKKSKNFQLYDLGRYLNQYRYDLKHAPFNTKDKKLAPEVGACTTCPSNSATLKTLFPEYAKQAVCSNKECYTNKCKVYFIKALTGAIYTYQPTALLYDNRLTEMDEQVIALAQGACELPRYNHHDISVIQKPEPPDKDNYTYDDELDEDEFDEALKAYNAEFDEYTHEMESGRYNVGLWLGNQSFEPMYFSLEKPTERCSHNGQMVTAKEVQAAIKAGTATPQLLEAEINRIKEREHRAEELDSEKVQLAVHQAMSDHCSIPEHNTGVTQADMVALRFVVFQSLDYHTKGQVQARLFPESNETDGDALKATYEAFKNLTEQQVSYLIRMSLCSKSDSKLPRFEAGYFLYRMAIGAGLSVQEIEDAQSKKACERKKRQEQKIHDLEKKKIALSAIPGE
jgi:ParB family chromosome partitioning protein